MKTFIEITDTFGGEANYSWVKRYSFETGLTDSMLQIVRKAMKVSGYTGCRTKKSDYGDCIRFDFDGMNVVMFITWGE